MTPEKRLFTVQTSSNSSSGEKHTPAEVRIPVKVPPSANTGLPASFLATLVTSPNPCLVTAFAEGQRRKCRAQDGGFGNPGTLGESRPKGTTHPRR